uniref:Secreted protein n=1 Tax=Ascaris lumbricoides TaxID=6252 RepID=A0A9J2PJC0_ASCLU
MAYLKYPKIRNSSLRDCQLEASGKCAPSALLFAVLLFFFSSPADEPSSITHEKQNTKHWQIVIFYQQSPARPKKCPEKSRGKIRRGARYVR